MNKNRLTTDSRNLSAVHKQKIRRNKLRKVIEIRELLADNQIDLNGRSFLWQPLYKDFKTVETGFLEEGC